MSAGITFVIAFGLVVFFLSNAKIIQNKDTSLQRTMYVYACNSLYNENALFGIVIGK